MATRTPRRKAQAAPEEITITRGSGNVFAYLGLPNPQERLAKARLAMLGDAPAATEKRECVSGHAVNGQAGWRGHVVSSQPEL